MSEQAHRSRETPLPHPHWWPSEAQWQGLPAAFRAAAERTILPAYRRLVLAAGNPLEWSAAGTLVFLMWLELLRQWRLPAMTAEAQLDGDELRAAKSESQRMLREARELNKKPYAPEGSGKGARSYRARRAGHAPRNARERSRDSRRHPDRP